ncbi:MAG: hypothetical protein M0Z50_01015 [Planctomycetia bacterium]|jgi:hypothetical protein|nr:hypothetical protein [Planctomycetia bacterium]
MNTLQKNLLSALPVHLQNEHKISEIARLNRTTFEDAVSMVWLRYAEQQEKNEHTDNVAHDLICAHKSPIIRLAQTYALTIKESETIINSQLVRLKSATSDELYEAGCAFLSEKTFNSARSKLRRETQPGSKNTFSLDDSDECNLHEFVTGNENGDDALAWLIAAETAAEREQELLKNGIDMRAVDMQLTELEKTPAEIAKSLNVTLRRGQQIAKHMRTAANNRLIIEQGGAGQQELF